MSRNVYHQRVICTELTSLYLGRQTRRSSTSSTLIPRGSEVLWYPYMSFTPLFLSCLHSPHRPGRVLERPLLLDFFCLSTLQDPYTTQLLPGVLGFTRGNYCSTFFLVLRPPNPRPTWRKWEIDTSDRDPFKGKVRSGQVDILVLNLWTGGH